MIYEDYMESLLTAVAGGSLEQTIDTIQNTRFSIKWRDNYSGLMAQNVQEKKVKQGYFDFIILKHESGEERKPTHRDLFDGLFSHSNILNCRRVWEGQAPTLIGQTPEEQKALTVFALMMFEQEVNFGQNEWQRHTFFKQNQKVHNSKRPRDMLMGYVEYLFDINSVDQLKFWNGDGTTVNFGGRLHDFEHKKYFTGLENHPMAKALVVGRNYFRFKKISDGAPPNHR